MPTPRKATGTTRNEVGLTSRQEYHQRQLASDPDAVACPVCAKLVKGPGVGAHRRRHILDGEIDAPLPYACQACGEAYETAASLGDHRRRGHGARKKSSNDTTRDRSERHDYVMQIATLPYREFVTELMKPWDR